MSDDTIRRSDAIKAFTVNSKGERLSYVDCDNFPIEFSLEYIVKTIIALPTADRPQGEWIKKPHKVYLPRDYEPDIIDYRDRQYNEEDHSIIQYWWHCNQCDYEASRWAKPTANFCPDCGTRMKGADHKTENSSEKPNNCKYAENPSGDVWECGCFLDTYCEHQIYDRNPDGTINIVKCGYEPKDEPQTEEWYTWQDEQEYNDRWGKE